MSRPRSPRSPLAVLVPPLIAVAFGACGSIGTPPAVEVNDTEISASSIEDELEAVGDNETYRTFVESQFQSPAAGQGGEGTFATPFVAGLLTQRVYISLFDDYADANGIEVTDDDLTSTRSFVDEQLQGTGGTFPGRYLDELVRSQALLNKVQQTVSEGLAPSDAEAYYAANEDDFDELCVRHILITNGASPGAPLDPEVDAEARARAQELAGEIDGLADLTRLAPSESDDPSAGEGGDLGCGGQGRFVPEFEAAAFALEPGQVSDVVRTQFGYHVVGLDSRRPRPFAEVQQEVEAAAQADLDEGLSSFVQGLVADADVRVDPRYGRWQEAQEGEQLGRVVPPVGPGATSIVE